MGIGLLIGVMLKYVLALLPVVLILFSKLVAGKTKVKWVLATLLIPFILKTVVYVLVLKQGDALPMYGSIVLGGWAPAIPLTWYISAWGIYFYFKIKYENPKRKKVIKVIAGILSATLVIWGLNLAFNSYKQQEAQTILNCGLEKIFTKNMEPNKLYFTSNYIHKSSSSYIGDIEGNNIILTSEYKNLRSLNECLKYSDNLNLIYPVGSKYNKTWKWEKHTTEINSTAVFSSEESVCSSDKYDRRENYEYIKWKTQFGDPSIKTNSDSFVFEINNTVKTTKAETIEFSQHFIGTTYSTDDNKYIFRISINDLSKVILWKFSEYGKFLKEVHINLPSRVVLDEGKGYYISNIEIDNNKIRFRLYETYRGDKEQNWKNICSYHTLEIEI